MGDLCWPNIMAHPAHTGVSGRMGGITKPLPAGANGNDLHAAEPNEGEDLAAPDE